MSDVLPGHGGYAFMGAAQVQSGRNASQRRSGESARSAVISAVSACGNGPTASTDAFSRACCSVRIPGKGMTDEQFKEMLAVVGFANANNRLVAGLRVEVDERFNAPA